MLVDVLELLRGLTRSMDRGPVEANLVLLVDSVDAYPFVREMHVDKVH